MLFGGVNNSSLLTEPCLADAVGVQVGLALPDGTCTHAAALSAVACQALNCVLNNLPAH